VTRSCADVPAAVSRLRELALSAAGAAAIRAAARLRIADALGDDPSTAEELAHAVGAAPDTLIRLLRALSWHGIFVEQPDGWYAHTEGSRLLREDSPASLRYLVLWATEPWTWELWPRLDDAIRSGAGVFHQLYGKDFFDYLHADAVESAEVFDRAMTQASRLSARTIADLLDLTGLEIVADIAGGQGHLLVTLLERHPELRGVLLELPNVVANADPKLQRGGPLSARARIVANDCRSEVPVSADVYVLKNVLEWDDESTVMTLRNVAAAAPHHAKIFIIENLIDASSEAKFTTAMDLLLLLNVGGKKHTTEGLCALIGRAGLQVNEIYPINSYLHMIQSTP
jgi:C-methyltransferase